MAGVALEPREVVSGIAERSHDITVDDAPLSLSRPAEPAPLLPPVRQSADVAAIHAAWSRVHAAERERTAAGTGIRARARARTSARASAVGAAQRDDRALIGDLIRATDVLAVRCDELADRVADLESLVEEIVCVVSEDLTHLRALLAGIAPAPASVGGTGGGAPVGESSSGTSTGDG